MDPTKGITCPDMRRVIREALHKGWVWDGFSGTTHGRILWPKTGAHLAFGLTPSLASWKTVATDIQKTSGVEVWRKGNRKRSRKPFRPSGYDAAHAARERAAWHDTWGDEVDALREAHARLSAELDGLIVSGTRADVERFRHAYQEIHDVEDRLEQLHQPITHYRPGAASA